MSSLNCRLAFRGWEGMTVLYERVVKATTEYPGFVIIADSPFFVTPNSELYRAEIVGARLVPARFVDTKFKLWSELEIIARAVLLENVFPEAQLITLNVWCIKYIPVLDKILMDGETGYIQYLKVHNLLN